jgi:GntR family histidine utilization transcriptional repressor
MASDLSVQTLVPAPSEPTAPAFQRIKTHILARIHAGHWKEGDTIPSEQALAAEFGVSRMTANRAVRELTDEQVLVRVQGSGTFVAQQQKYQATLVEIRSIAQEVAARGHAHRAALHRLASVRADEAQAAAFGVAPGAALFHSVVVHFENEVPIQVEDRLVLPALAPDYLQLDFTRTTANEYLMRVAPLQGVRYRIEAQLPPAEVAAMLAMPVRQPCLVLWRQTLSKGSVASVATLWHPGDRYRFAGSF